MSEQDYPMQAIFPWTMPFSGDVSQHFPLNPNWFSNSAFQWGAINVHLGRTYAPGLEREILRCVGSYGRQLSKVMDAIEALTEAVLGNETDAKDERSSCAMRLSDKQLLALAEFRKLTEEIKRVKEKAKA